MFAFLLAATLSAQPMTVAVDAREARRGVFHSAVTMPAVPGPMRFVYPKWIPGEHSPSGPIEQVMGLRVTSHGESHSESDDQTLVWRRDPVDMFAFDVDVPKGASSIEVDFDYISPPVGYASGYGETPNHTQHLLDLPWNHVVVYPAGQRTDAIQVNASVKLPEGWKSDTALPNVLPSGPVSLTTLIDSPLIAGEYFRTIPLAPDTKISMVADSQAALALPDDRVAQLTKLVAETDALFGARHYRKYTWLLTLSDVVETQGLEHHESSDNRAVEKGITDSDLQKLTMSTLSHEFVHSWNGKYRRPAGLATPDYQQPMLGELLWVYEGMTRYLGNFVLTSRSGLFTPEFAREYSAFVAANLDRNRTGRDWRPLVDTAVSVQTLGEAPFAWTAYRRALDYYDEMLLVWLDVDTTIRKKTNGAKSLDDFTHAFHGAPSSAPMVKPYTFDDVVATLNSVAPNDWATFLRDRIYKLAPHPPLGALEAAGWRLAYSNQPNAYLKAREHSSKRIDVTFSLGILFHEDGKIDDLTPGTPAALAGLTAGMEVTSINGRKWSADALHEEIAAKRALDVIAGFGEHVAMYSIDYRGGEQYPHLERVEGNPDLLSEIMRPRSR
jgi:predicted metalloprotease with PDZ domain